MADTGDFSRSVTKIDRMQHLAAMPLDDAEATRVAGRNTQYAELKSADAE